MSRKSIAEYVAEKRRAYAVSSTAKRTRILNEVCETLDFTRKYVIKLMTGNIRYRERKGRGKTYSDEDLENARKLWISVGCPCSTYFVAELPRIIKEYDECIALIKPASSKSALMSISASTLVGCKDLEADLIKLEEEWSDYNNFFRPTKMIIAKYRKDNGKGFTRIYEAGGPITPYKRLLATKILTKDQETALTKRYESLNGVFLYQQILRRLKRILNKQEKYLQSKREEKRILQEARLEASSLRDAPSGTASAASLLDGTISLLPKPLSKRKQHLKGVKYLTNQKHKNQSQGAHSI